MGRYRSIQATLIESSLKGLTDNQTITAYKKDCKLFAAYCKEQGVKVNLCIHENADRIVVRRYSMDYKKEIGNLLNEIQSEKFLKFLYNVIVSFKKQWGY